MASMEISSATLTGTLSAVMEFSSLIIPSSVTVLRLEYLLHRSEIFHNFTVLSVRVKSMTLIKTSKKVN